MSGVKDYFFCIYISGISKENQEIILKFKGLANKKLSGRYFLEVIDILEHPELAKKSKLWLLLLLLKKSPTQYKKQF
ncbi:MAG: hypothetical protein A3E83_00980 [Gammaproteobacteria bacterium RIFCSPHIGHO2_12_FULL_41_20]|nr:MAG: hypothetical protein A3E83_00980 [Gammaproteobacteria bacterium RIFCSPHIGHO2_12_FULL_41_20]